MWTVLFHSGDRVGPYELIEVLGSGGMGVVWKALDPRLGREVAIKVLSADLETRPDRLQRFEFEARTVSSLNHPNILTVFDVGNWKGTRYLVTELLEGATLREAEREQEIDLERAIGFALQIANGLAAAHEQGIAHRDLKPDNIFVTDDGRLKILDFGLARLAAKVAEDDRKDAATATALTSVGQVLGTAGYMSPEQVRARPSDARSDVFSFGCMLFELVTGMAPFARASTVETMAATLRRDPLEPAVVDGLLPRPLERILERCLQKHPEKRYPSAVELAEDLEALARGLANGEVRVPSAAWPLRRARFWLRRHRRQAIAWSAALAVAGLGAWLWLDPGETRGRRKAAVATAGSEARLASVAVLPFANSSGDPDVEYLCDGITEEVMSVLGRVAGVRVPGRTSSFRFKDREIDLADVGEKLGVESVLKGAVEVGERTLTVSARLVAVPDGHELWSGAYDGERADLVAIPQEVATAIVSKLLGEIAGDQTLPSGTPEAVDFETFELFLQGRYHLNRRTAEGLRRAQDYFQEVLERDRGYAPAWSGLADSYSLLLEYGHLSLEEAVPKAETAARHALELAPLLADGHASLGLVLDLAGRSEEAEREYRLALARDPRHVNAHLWLGSHLVTRGRSVQALPFLERAVELDPLLMVARVNLLIGLYEGRRFEEAVAYAESATEFAAPEDDLLPWWRAWLYADRAGRPDEALAICDRWLARTAGEPVANAQWQLLRAIALVHAGREQEARALLGTIEARYAAEPTYRGIADLIALAHAALGQADPFVAWAKVTVRADPSEFGVRVLESSPDLDRVRSDPAFAEFVEWRRRGEG